LSRTSQHSETRNTRRHAKNTRSSQTSRRHDASRHLRDIIRRNRKGELLGAYSICSAHPAVIQAGFKQAIADGSLLLIESTSSQVNQYGGYTGQTPEQFAAKVRSAARAAGVPQELLALGGDHLGPYPWRDQPSETALQKACELVRACVRAGYQKIHLDASMACADDGHTLNDETIAQRTALLCRAAENAHSDLSSPLSLLYVIGTEVPIPGGETEPGQPPAVTTARQVRHSVNVFWHIFEQHDLFDAWERVIAIVVQPGVEFGENIILPYDRRKARALSAALPEHPCLVFEAHSTDYQTRSALSQMVEDHFAILKVGPALTFAYREAVFALSAVERDYFSGRRSVRLSQVREALESAMQRNPSYWRSYYHGDEQEQRLARAFSYSDRCRYYWTDAEVQKEIVQLLNNLSSNPLPAPLLSQYLPIEYAAIWAGELRSTPQAIIQHHIRLVLRGYASACGLLTKRSKAH
jgi:D-tagatose-1,6-bisphosphate aldolase subunit GatZ/KbaZ